MRIAEITEPGWSTQPVAPRILARVPREQAEDMLHDAYFGGKNKDLEPRRFHKEREDFYLVDLPLRMIRGNENGDRYDDTVDMRRAQVYSTQQIDTPISVRFGMHSVRNGALAFVSDGGHRVSAARLRGDRHIRALIPIPDYERLVTMHG